MKCPKCGTTNGKTNKFCRECGKKLDWPKEQIEQSVARVSGPLDDLELGEELFDIMKIYDDGDIDSAGERIDKIIEHNPESASAHSIRALIYERKADLEAEAGNAKAAQDFLKLAVGDYERILELNPKSAADREKLIGVRMKLAGRTTPKPAPQTQSSKRPTASASANKVKSFLLSVPSPVLAAVGAFVIIVVLASVLMFKGEGKKKAEVAVKPVQPANGVQNANPPASTANGVANSGSDAQIYQYPTAPTTPTAPQMPEVPKQATHPVEPLKLPKINPEMILVAEKPRPAAPKAVVKVEEGAPKVKPLPAPAQVEDNVPDQPSGSNLLAKAITLGNQGRNAEAINAAQQAIALFQADINAGRNITSSQRGLDNANKYIQLWQSENQ